MKVDKDEQLFAFIINCYLDVVVHSYSKKVDIYFIDWQQNQFWNNKYLMSADSKHSLQVQGRVYWCLKCCNKIHLVNSSCLSSSLSKTNLFTTFSFFENTFDGKKLLFKLFKIFRIFLGWMKSNLTNRNV